MLHVLQGVIGIKIFESDSVTLKNVVVEDLKNIADDSHWMCKKLPNGQIPADSHLSANAAKVTGIKFRRATNVHNTGVRIDNLDSEEGTALCFEKASFKNVLSPDRNNIIVANATMYTFI